MQLNGLNWIGMKQEWKPTGSWYKMIIHVHGDLTWWTIFNTISVIQDAYHRKH